MGAGTPFFRCGCGLALATPLDPREWLTLAEFASALGSTYHTEYGRALRHGVAGLLRLPGQRLLVNLPRFAWCSARRGEQRVPRVEFARAPLMLAAEMPCPACGATVTVDASRAGRANRHRVAEYVRTTPGALKKRVQRGQFPPVLPGQGRSLIWNPIALASDLRAAMLSGREWDPA